MAFLLVHFISCSKLKIILGKPNFQNLKELKMFQSCYNSVGNIVRGVELLKLVNIEATKAWNTTSSSRDTSSDSADDLVICLKVLFDIHGKKII